MLEAVSVIQWCLYYPAILDAAEIGLTPQQEQDLNESLSAYRAGDLLQALAAYPAGRQPAGPAETIYRAGLLLAAGHVEQTEALLNTIGAVPNPPAGAAPPARLADALRQLIATVNGKGLPAAPPPPSAREW